jgi:hypothetical protein
MNMLEDFLDGNDRCENRLDDMDSQSAITCRLSESENSADSLSDEEPMSQVLSSQEDTNDEKIFNFDKVETNKEEPKI